MTGAIRHVAVYLGPAPTCLKRYSQQRIGCVPQVPRTAPPSLQTWTHYSSNRVRSPDTSPRGQPHIPPLMCHGSPTTHPHRHSPPSSEQWVCPNYKRYNPHQTLRWSSRESSHLGSRCLQAAVDVPLQSARHGLDTKNNVHERNK